MNPTPSDSHIPALSALSGIAQGDGPNSPTSEHHTPLISVIVVSYFTGSHLSATIDSVLSQDFSFELIVVDNGNPNTIVEELRSRSERHEEMRLLTGHGNVGFATACNLGAKKASGKFLLFLNPDAELSAHTLSRFHGEGAKLTPPWMLGPKLLNEDGTEQRGGRRDVLTPWTALIEGLKLYKLAPNSAAVKRFNKHEGVAPTNTSPVPVISGACMFLPADDYWSIGGMDQGYFLHVEDVDFCFRFRKSGGRTFFVPSIEVVHHKSTSAAPAYFVEWHKTKGFVRYFWKNFRPDYPALFLLLLSAGIVLFFMIKMAIVGVARAFGFLRMRNGKLTAGKRS